MEIAAACFCKLYLGSKGCGSENLTCNSYSDVAHEIIRVKAAILAGQIVLFLMKCVSLLVKFKVFIERSVFSQDAEPEAFVASLVTLIFLFNFNR